MIDLEAEENWHARKIIEQDGGCKEDNYIDITWQHNAPYTHMWRYERRIKMK